MKAKDASHVPDWENCGQPRVMHQTKGGSSLQTMVLYYQWSLHLAYLQTDLLTSGWSYRQYTLGCLYNWYMKQNQMLGMLNYTLSPYKSIPPGKLSDQLTQSGHIWEWVKDHLEVQMQQLGDACEDVFLPAFLGCIPSASNIDAVFSLLLLQCDCCPEKP